MELLVSNCKRLKINKSMQPNTNRYASHMTHLNKEDKVLERGVEVRLLLQLDYRIKVLVVDVSVNTEQSLQNRFGHRHEVLWERNPFQSQSHKVKTLKAPPCVQFTYNSV